MHMSTPSVSIVLQQLVVQLPMLLVYLGGIIFALAYLKKSRTPSILTLLATSTLLFVAITFTVAQSYILQSMSGNRSTAAQLSQAMSILAVTGSLIRAAAVAVLITAVFIDRGHRADTPIYRPQFGLRALLWGVTLFCIVAGLISTVIWWSK
jgi:hypothetical protein